MTSQTRMKTDAEKKGPEP